jgi:hypothetical protein
MLLLTNSVLEQLVLLIMIVFQLTVTKESVKTVTIKTQDHTVILILVLRIVNVQVELVWLVYAHNVILMLLVRNVILIHVL